MQALFDRLYGGWRQIHCSQSVERRGFVVVAQKSPGPEDPGNNLRLRGRPECARLTAANRGKFYDLGFSSTPKVICGAHSRGRADSVGREPRLYFFRKAATRTEISRRYASGA